MADHQDQQQQIINAQQAVQLAVLPPFFKQTSRRQVQRNTMVSGGAIEQGRSHMD